MIVSKFLVCLPYQIQTNNSPKQKNKMKTLISAQIQTKSNYRNLNNLWFQVTEMMNDRITCLVEIDGKLQKVDFNISEIKGFRYNAQ